MFRGLAERELPPGGICTSTILYSYEYHPALATVLLVPTPLLVLVLVLVVATLLRSELFLISYTARELLVVAITRYGTVRVIGGMRHI